MKDIIIPVVVSLLTALITAVSTGYLTIWKDINKAQNSIRNVEENIERIQSKTENDIVSIRAAMKTEAEKSELKRSKLSNEIRQKTIELANRNLMLAQKLDAFCNHTKEVTTILYDVGLWVSEIETAFEGEIKTLAVPNSKDQVFSVSYTGVHSRALVRLRSSLDELKVLTGFASQIFGRLCTAKGTLAENAVPKKLSR